MNIVKRKTTNVNNSTAIEQTLKNKRNDNKKQPRSTYLERGFILIISALF